MSLIIRYSAVHSKECFDNPGDDCVCTAGRVNEYLHTLDKHLQEIEALIKGASEDFRKQNAPSGLLLLGQCVGRFAMLRVIDKKGDLPPEER